MAEQKDKNNPQYTIFEYSNDIRSAYGTEGAKNSIENIQKFHQNKWSLPAKEQQASLDKSVDKAKLFNFTSNNRSALQQHMDLLAEVAKDDGFVTSEEDYKKRVEYYYRSYKDLLYLDAVYGDNFQNQKLYAHKDIATTAAKVKTQNVESKIRKDFLDLIYMFFHTSMMQQFLNKLNKYRVTVIFYRFTWMSFWSLAEKAGWLSENGNLAGVHIDQDALRDIGFVFLVYSLVIYGLRILMMLGLAIKHIFYPEEAEKCRSTWARFLLEVQKHWYFFINDSAKEIITLMILAPQLFNIASCYIPLLTGCLVLLDLIKSCYRLINEMLNYKQIKAELIAQANSIQDTGSEQDKKIISLMQEKLELQHLEKMSKLTLSLITNILMLSGFIAVSVVAPYAVIPALLLFCTVVRVMDVTSDKFGAFMRARKEFMDNPANSCKAAARDAKLYDLQTSFLKNLLLPMLLVGLVVVSWQLALVVTAIYLCVEYSQTLVKPEKNDPVEEAFTGLTI